MRIPTNSRQTETDSTASDHPATAAGAASTDTSPDRSRPQSETPNSDNAPSAPGGRTYPQPAPQGGYRTGTESNTYRHAEPDAAATDRNATDRTMTDRTMTDHTVTDRTMTDETTADRAPVIAGPKPRASLLATLGLICGVAAALLVLSGPLLGWGIGVAGLALVLSLGGIHATGKRHVAGKTDALIGMLLALGAIVVGVLALTGSLSWLGTDTQPVSNLREWLDANVVNRF